MIMVCNNPLAVFFFREMDLVEDGRLASWRMHHPFRMSPRMFRRFMLENNWLVELQCGDALSIILLRGWSLPVPVGSVRTPVSGLGQAPRGSKNIIEASA